MARNELAGQMQGAATSAQEARLTVVTTVACIQFAYWPCMAVVDRAVGDLAAAHMAVGPHGREESPLPLVSHSVCCSL